MCQFLPLSSLMRTPDWRVALPHVCTICPIARQPPSTRRTSNVQTEPMVVSDHSSDVFNPSLKIDSNEWFMTSTIISLGWKGAGDVLSINRRKQATNIFLSLMKTGWNQPTFPHLSDWVWSALQKACLLPTPRAPSCSLQTSLKRCHTLTVQIYVNRWLAPGCCTSPPRLAI